MKKRRMSGWVTVTGPPFRICSRNRGTTLPLLPSTLPKRTVENEVPLPTRLRLDDELGDPLGRAHHARRVHRLVGRDQDEAVDAVQLGRLARAAACRARCS